MHCHKCFFDDLHFSCNKSNQVAARRSSRSQNSRPQRDVDRPSCYATAVCGGTACMMRLSGGLHYRNFGNKNDKWQTNKSKTWGWYLQKKESQNGIFTNNLKRMVKTLLSQTVCVSKKTCVSLPPFSAGFSPTSFGGQLKCRFWTCQLGQKLQGSCFTWWVPFVA